jgi:hypothetical protein
MQTNPCTKASEARMNTITHDRTRSTKGANTSTPSTINRWGFLKTAGTLALVTAMHTPFAYGQDAIGQRPGAQPKPNILLIYADDLGWGDVGYQSEGLFLTPHIDRLAREGVVFSIGYAAAPNCGPSRSSIMSGGYTHRHGMFSQGRGNIWGPHNQMRLVQVKSQNHLAPSIVTVAEALKGAGYATAHFGKWQLAAGDIPGSSPLEQGFDVAFHSFDDGGGIKDKLLSSKAKNGDITDIFQLLRFEG